MWSAPFHFGNHRSPRISNEKQLAAIESGMRMSRAQAVQAGIHQLPTNFDETAGPHYGENNLAVRNEAGFTPPLDVELSDLSV